MNMIERVARAICKSDDPDNDWDSKDMSDYTRNAWSVYAKAAIEAMREPTEELALYIKGLRYDVEHIANYRKIIDAAFKEE